MTDYREKNQNGNLKPLTSAIIVAAGSSTRMGEDYGNKQLLEIKGIPILMRTVAAFEEAKTVDEIVIITKGNLIIPIADMAKSYGFKKVICVVKGGETRQKSVSLGIENISENSEFVCIHDGARPFITPFEIDAVNNAAYKHSAATIGVPLKDTIKTVDTEGFIVNTQDRTTLRAVQTPQSFNLTIFKPALQKARREGKDYTDDCQLIENDGGKVFMIEGSFDNIKITTSEDLALAEIIVRKRKE